MRKFWKIFGLVAVCYFAGFGLATGFMNIRKSLKSGKDGYIARSDIRIEDGTMTPEVLLSMGRLSDPQLSPDGSTILYGVSYTSIEQNRSCRNLFVCKPDGSGRKQLTRYSKSVSNARWSQDGRFIYFIQGGQLYKVSYAGGAVGKRVCLSDVPEGMGEFSISPDEKHIMYTSTVKNGALAQPSDSDPALDKAQAYASEDLMYRHWDHWVTTTPRTYVAPLSEKITAQTSTDILGSEPFELPTEPFGGMEQLSWSPDGRHIAYSCRKKTGKQYAFSTNSCIYIYDLESGTTSAVTTRGGYDTDPVWSPDGTRLAFISMRRDGYEADAQRLMVAFAPGFEVRELAAELDRDKSGVFWNGSEEIYFNALTDGQQAIFKVGLDSGEAQRITPEDWHYDFFSPWAVCGDELLCSYYCLNFPLELVAVKADGSSFRQITGENEHILSQLDEPESRSISVKTVDGKDMQCWVLYPPHFDPEKTYPGVEIVLGGPQGTNSQDWSYRWCYRLMAQQGYVVILPNRRGTTAFGQEWKEQISGDYCGLNMQDYLSAGKWLKNQPYIGKLACVGASYGGYSAYMLEGLHGDLFDCFIAHAGIFDEKQLWYTTEEMWFANWDNGGLTEYAFNEGQQGPAGDGITFGGMQQAGAPYATTPKAVKHYANSPSSMVTRWHTPILCIHGMMDYRIPYEQGMAAFNAAQMMGVPSRLIVFPEENHWILQPQNSLYWHREFYAWLDRWCK